MEEIILVDIYDNEIGTIDKMEAHLLKKLHRAFSLFIVYDNKILLQRRADNKYHSPGKWANACCSHPKPNKSIIDSIIDRTREELGIEIEDPKKLFDFIYFSEYDNGLTEYELDNVFIIEKYFDSIPFDKEEVSEVAWVDIDELSQQLIDKPNKFATWFLNCAPRVINILKNRKY